MKKILAALLALCLTVAHAETLDLAAYSDGDLLALLKQVQGEVVSRNIEKTAHLIAGTYIGGQDVPAGSYVLTAAGLEESYGILSLRSADDPEDDYPSKLYDFRYGNEPYAVFVTIDEGDALTLPFPCTLTVSSGMMFQ